MEVHFGKPVAARVRRCRLVVVKNRLLQEEEKQDDGDSE